MTFILFIILYIICAHAGECSEHWNVKVIKPNVLVMQVHNLRAREVPLYCGDSYEGMEILWKKDGTQLEQQGNQINTTVRAMLGGNFTCHSTTGDFLNHTLVLVEGIDFEKKILEMRDEKDYVTCLSNNFNGKFHCFWKKTEGRKEALVELFSATRSSSNINCSLDSDGSGLTCEDPQHCHNTEEVSRINLTLYFRNIYRLEEYARHFYIHEIVKPDRVNITNVQGNVIEWEYPKTWSHPASYYPLRFQVKVVHHHENCDHQANRLQSIPERQQNFTVRRHKKNYTFCIRARDGICNSIWSDWSYHKRTEHQA